MSKLRYQGYVLRIERLQLGSVLGLTADRRWSKYISKRLQTGQARPDVASK